MASPAFNWSGSAPGGGMDSPAQNREAVDLRAYVALLWRRKWVVVLPCLIAGIVGWIVTLPKIMRPVYQASAMLMVEFPRPLAKELQGLVTNPGVEERLARLQSQIQSTEFLTTLIKNTQMGNDKWVRNWAKKNLKQYPDLTEDQLVELWLTRYLREAIQVAPGKGGPTNIIVVSVADYYPERARDLVQNITAGVIEASRSTNMRAARSTESFSSSQLLEYKQKLDDAEAKYEAFNRSLAGQSARPSLVTQAAQPRVLELRSDARTDTDAQAAAVADAAQRLRRAGGSPDRALSALSNSEVSEQVANGRDLEQTYVRQTILDVGATVATSSGTALQLARTIEGLRGPIRAALGGSYSGDALSAAEEFLLARVRADFANARLAAYDSHLHEYTSRVVGAPEADLELRRLGQEVERYRTLYNAFYTQQTSADISEAFEASPMGERINVLEPPSRPLKPSKPNRPALIAMSILVGLSLGVLGAFVLEHHDQSFRDVRDVESDLKLKVIGTIPIIPTLGRNKRGPKTLPEAAEQSMREFLEDSPGFREFRRTALALLRSGESGPSSLLITSARSDEGKSTAATCLALTLARELPRERVLLVDLDTRKPSVSGLLGMATDNGADVGALIRDRRWSDACMRQTLLPNFFVLPMRLHPELAREGLTADSVQWLLPELRARADRIIIDGPPNLPVPDPLILGPEVDGVITVVKAGVTPRETVRRSVELQRGFRDNLLGVLLNNVTQVLPYYYHYSHYGYGYTAGNKPRG